MELITVTIILILISFILGFSAGFFVPNERFSPEDTKQSELDRKRREEYMNFLLYDGSEQDDII